MIDFPLPNGDKGDADRDERGRFRKGWRGGPGNPNNKKTAALRRAISKAVSRDDVADVVGVLVTKAKAGDIQAINSLLDRVVGKAVAADVLLRIEALENALAERDAEWASSIESNI